MSAQRPAQGGRGSTVWVFIFMLWGASALASLLMVWLVQGHDVLLRTAGFITSLLTIFIGVLYGLSADARRRAMRATTSRSYPEEAVQQLAEMTRQSRQFAQNLSATTRALEAQSQAAVSQMQRSFEPLIAELDEDRQRSESTVHDALHTMEELTQTVGQLAKRSVEQASHVHRFAGIVSQMAAAIHEVDALAEVVAQDAKEATAIATSGNAQVVQGTSEMEALSRSVAHAAGHFDTLGARSAQIDQVIATISDFAEQTNLLALNAAIEAARAGEAGRGFAIVAQEVRNLSERSATATAEISALIREVQKGITQGVKAIRTAAQQAEQSMDRAHATSESLRQIQGAIDSTARRSTQIVQHAQMLDKTSGELVESIAQLAATTEENAATSGEVVAVGEVVLASARETNQGSPLYAQATMHIQQAVKESAELAKALSTTINTLHQLAAGLHAAADQVSEERSR